MVHVFNYKDKNYIYDSGSGSLHECDDKTAEYLKGNTAALTAEEISQIKSDIEELKAKGLLYKEEVKTYPLKSNEVKALCLHICHDCNLRCRYCFADEGAYHSAREFMSEETAKKAIDFLIKSSVNRKVLEVDFFGGEPLMCLQTIKNVVAYARAEGEKSGKRFLFTTTTNALLLDDDAIDFFNREMENVV
ncbi:MAG: 4Fe-4S cluster-binding domain-containing protein, partial [Clostridia bacterium]|nr:4Fe-4S cluster-binding domain-containing protein [Clostridia bacterium]